MGSSLALRCVGPIWDLAYVTLRNIIRKHWPCVRCVRYVTLRYVACVKFLRKTVALRACVALRFMETGPNGGIKCRWDRQKS